jgi:hypothetical protein
LNGVVIGLALSSERAAAMAVDAGMIAGTMAVAGRELWRFEPN